MNRQELKAIRKQLGWSQARLADAVGVTSNSIARQERGEIGIKEPLARLIRLIAEKNESTRTTHTPDQVANVLHLSRRKVPTPSQGKGRERAG